MMYQEKHGRCDECNYPLKAVYFKEEEYYPNSFIPTGRIRQAVDYLICPICLKQFIVDSEYYVGDWYEERLQ